MNITEMKIYGDVSEAYLPSIHKGDWAEVTFPIYADMKLDATIHRIGQVINEKSRTFRIEIKLDNKDGKLRPNLITRIRKIENESKQIKEEAIESINSLAFNEELTDILKSSINVDTNEAIIIGDDIESDIKGAENAGIRGFLVETGKGQKKFQKNLLSKIEPFLTLKTFSELRNLL